MTRMLIAAAGAALLSAGPAAAGPIAWGYSTQLIAGPDVGGGSFDPDRVTPAGGTAVGAATVPLFGVSPYTYGDPLRPGDFTARFTITDAASGASHSFVMVNRAVKS